MDRFKALRYFAYTVEILVVFMLQETPGLIPPLFGARPTLLLPLALSIAMFESETAAMGFGLLSGLLIDFGISGTLGFHGLLLTVLCYSIGVMVINLLRTNLLTALLTAAVSLAVIFFLQWIFYYVLFDYQHLYQNEKYVVYSLTNHYFPRYCYTLALTPVFYYFNRAFAFLIREKE